jgi:hypothetical protein
MSSTLVVSRSVMLFDFTSRHVEVGQRHHTSRTSRIQWYRSHDMELM